MVISSASAPIEAITPSSALLSSALAAAKARGVRACRQGDRDYGRLPVVERSKPRDYPYFWFGLAATVTTPGHQRDLEVIADGFVTVTPRPLDFADERYVEALRTAFDKSMREKRSTFPSLSAVIRVGIPSCSFTERL